MSTLIVLMVIEAMLSYCKTMKMSDLTRGFHLLLDRMGIELND